MMKNILLHTLFYTIFTINISSFFNNSYCTTFYSKNNTVISNYSTHEYTKNIQYNDNNNNSCINNITNNSIANYYNNKPIIRDRIYNIQNNVEHKPNNNNTVYIKNYSLQKNRKILNNNNIQYNYCNNHSIRNNTSNNKIASCYIRKLPLKNNDQYNMQYNMYAVSNKNRIKRLCHTNNIQSTHRQEIINFLKNDIDYFKIFAQHKDCNQEQVYNIFTKLLNTINVYKTIINNQYNSSGGLLDDNERARLQQLYNQNKKLKEQLNKQYEQYKKQMPFLQQYLDYKVMDKAPADGRIKYITQFERFLDTLKRNSYSPQNHNKTNQKTIFENIALYIQIKQKLNKSGQKYYIKNHNLSEIYNNICKDITNYGNQLLNMQSNVNNELIKYEKYNKQFEKQELIRKKNEIIKQTLLKQLQEKEDTLKHAYKWYQQQYHNIKQKYINSNKLLIQVSNLIFKNTRGNYNNFYNKNNQLLLDFVKSETNGNLQEITNQIGSNKNINDNIHFLQIIQTLSERQIEIITQLYYILQSKITNQQSGKINNKSYKIDIKNFLKNYAKQNWNAYKSTDSIYSLLMYITLYKYMQPTTIHNSVKNYLISLYRTLPKMINNYSITQQTMTNIIKECYNGKYLETFNILINIVNKLYTVYYKNNTKTN